MLDWLKDRLFGNKIFRVLEDELIEIHGEARGKQCLGMFATAITKAQDLRDAPKDLLEQISQRARKSGLRVEDAVVAYLDASLTVIKRLGPGKGTVPEADAIIDDMETVLDRMFLKFQTMVVPRNGSAGPAMAEFTTDPSSSSID